MIESTLNETKKTEAKPKYPCLKISEEGLVVLFTKERTGTVLIESSQRKLRVGFYGDSWLDDLFKPFDESITLKNVY